MSDKQKLTTNAGAPVPDNQNVMTAGKRGPQLLQDTWFIEKLAHFDREVNAGTEPRGSAPACSCKTDAACAHRCVLPGCFCNGLRVF